MLKANALFRSHGQHRNLTFTDFARKHYEGKLYLIHLRAYMCSFICMTRNLVAAS